MAEIVVERDRADPHVYVLSTLGSVRLPSKPTGEVVITVPEEPDWRVNRAGPTFARTWHAIDLEDRIVAILSWNDRRVVTPQREFDFAFKPATLFKGPGPFVITEQGRELIRIPRRSWRKNKRIVMTIVDEPAARADPHLTAFHAWSASELSRAAGVL